MTMCCVTGSLTGAEIGVKWGPGIGPVSGSSPEGVDWGHRPILETPFGVWTWSAARAFCTMGGPAPSGVRRRQACPTPPTPQPQVAS